MEEGVGFPTFCSAIQKSQIEILIGGGAVGVFNQFLFQSPKNLNPSLSRGEMGDFLIFVSQSKNAIFYGNGQVFSTFVPGSKKSLNLNYMGGGGVINGVVPTLN